MAKTRNIMLSLLCQMQAPRVGRLCEACGKSGAEFRCLHCHCRPQFCLECLHQYHRWNPFHKIEEWAGTHYRKTSLAATGFILHIGHAGQPCPSLGDTAQATGSGAMDPSKSSQMLIGDVHGKFSHNVAFCECQNSVEKWIQLFLAGHFPASTISPKTAFTFHCLDHAFIDLVECHTSCMSFDAKLERLTDNLFPQDVPVSHYSIYLFFSLR